MRANGFNCMVCGQRYCQVERADELLAGRHPAASMVRSAAGRASSASGAHGRFCHTSNRLARHLGSRWSTAGLKGSEAKRMLLMVVPLQVVGLMCGLQLYGKAGSWREGRLEPRDAHWRQRARVEHRAHCASCRAGCAPAWWDLTNTRLDHPSSYTPTLRSRPNATRATWRVPRRPGAAAP